MVVLSRTIRPCIGNDLTTVDLEINAVQCPTVRTPAPEPQGLTIESAWMRCLKDLCTASSSTTVSEVGVPDDPVFP